MKLVYIMKTIFVIVVLILFIHAKTGLASTPKWLIGCWESADKKSKEIWVAEPDGSLTGFGVVLKNSDIAFYEVLRIVSNDGGTLTYTAHPSGQAAATFTARLNTENSISFSNPRHDYPQEISYRNEGEILFATISALNGEKAQSFNKQLCK